MSDPLKALLELQEIDLTRDRLLERREHLQSRAELRDMEARMGEVRVAIDRVREESDAVSREIERLEQDISTIVDKISSEETRMYSGEIMNPKELSAMQDEIGMLRRRKAPLEEGELEQMMRRDELIAEREALQKELADLDREADGIRQRIGSEEGEIDREIADEDAKAGELTSQIPDDLLETYRELRGQKRGIGVGTFEGGSCSACREALSAVEVDRIKRKVRDGERLFRCEHCRRLLVVQ